MLLKSVPFACPGSSEVALVLILILSAVYTALEIESAKSKELINIEDS